MVEELSVGGMREAEQPRLIVVLGGARSGKSRYAEELAARLAGAGPVVFVATATAYDDEMRARIAQHRAERPAAWATIEAPRDPATALRAYLVAANDQRAPAPTLPSPTGGGVADERGGRMAGVATNQRSPSATPLAPRSSPVGEGRVGAARLPLPSPAATPLLPRAILLDCLTLLAANLLAGEGAIPDEPFDPAPANTTGEVSVAHGADDATQIDAQAAAMSEARVLRAVDDVVAVARDYTIPLIVVTNEVGMGLVPPYPLGRIYRDILGRANARLVAQADAALLMLAGLPIELKALAAAWRDRAQRLGDARAPYDETPKRDEEAIE